MPNLRNEAIGRVRIASLNEELDYYETIWIENSDVNEEIRNLISRGVLKVVGQKNPNLRTSSKQNTGNRRRSSPLNSHVFPFGQKKEVSEKEQKEIKTGKVKSALSKILPENHNIDVELTNNISEGQLDKLLAEQTKTNKLLETLMESGVNIKADNKPISKDNFPDLHDVYIPNVDLNKTKSEIQVDSKTNDSKNLDKSSSSLKKIRKSKESVDDKESGK